MRLSSRGVAAAILAVAGCGEGPLEPDTPGPEPIRTVLFHRQDTGENLLLNSDGSEAGRLEVPGTLNVPIGVSAAGRILAVVHGSVLALVRLDAPGQVDTIVAPLPQQISPASFSADARFVALVAYLPFRGILVYDRANRRLDTLDYGQRDAVLPPVFSPDNSRIAVITASRLSLFSTVVFPDDPTRIITETFEFSRFLTIPIFGWPRWTDEGLLMAFVREGGTDPDTLLSVVIDPANPVRTVNEQFRAVLSPVSDARPELVFDVRSTYSYAEDGSAIVVGAHPGTGGAERHALYLVTPRAPRVQLLLDDPAQVPVLPNFVN